MSKDQLIKRLELEIPALESFLETLTKDTPNYRVIEKAIIRKRQEYVLEAGKPYESPDIQAILRKYGKGA